MKNILVLFLVSVALAACAQTSGIRDFQMSVKPSQRDSIMILSNDTVTTSPKYGTAKFVNPYILVASIVDSLYATALADDSTWLHLGDSLPPPFVKYDDHIWHSGAVTIGYDTTFGGFSKLSVVGPIEQRWPINKENVAIGPSVMTSGVVTGDHNVAIGRSAMRDLTSGTRNSALGAGALQAVTTGSDNLGVGEGALQSLTTGQDNSAVGRGALNTGSDPDGNVAIGMQSLYFCGTDFNVAIGYNAIGGFDFAFTGGNENVAIGSYAGYGFAGEDNVALGDSAGYSWTGNNALFIDNSPTANPLIKGDFAGDALTINGTLAFRDDAGAPTGLAGMNNRTLTRVEPGWGVYIAGDSVNVDATIVADSIGGGGDPGVWFETGAVAANDIADEIYHTGDVHIGDATMAGGGKLNVLGRIDQKYPTLSLRNIALGDNSLNGSMTGDFNVGIGINALLGLTSGGTNVAIGLQSAQTLTTGSNNVAIGGQSLYSNSTSSNNLAIGYQAAYSTTGEGNAAIGLQALYSNTSGFYNMAIGAEALYSNLSGAYNVGIGYRAGKALTTSNNVAIGGNALAKNSSGQKNMAIGSLALHESLSGSDNVGIGNSALQNTTTGYQNVAIGTNALLGGSANGGYNNIGIGAGAGQAVTGNSNVLIGSSAMGQNTGNENVAIGVVAGYNNLTGSGNVFIGTTAGYNETGSNKLYIDNSTTASPLIHGDFSTDELFVNGKLGYSTEGGAATTLAGRDASEDFTNVTIGTGLLLSAGTLSNTGVISEVDGSITNEGILGVGAGGASSATLITNTSTGNPVTVNVTGILTISESTSSNGGSMTLGATEVDGSITNELEMFQIDGVLQSAGPVTFDMDGASFSITESPANDFDIQINPERVEDIVGGMVTGNTETGIAVTYDDVNAKLNFVVSGGSDTNMANNNLSFDNDRTHDMNSFDLEFTEVDSFIIDRGAGTLGPTLIVDGDNDRVGIGTLSPDVAFEVQSNSGSANVAEFVNGTANGQAKIRIQSNQDNSTPMGGIDFTNTDATSGWTDYTVGSISLTRESSSAAGGWMDLSVGYNSSGSVDNVIRLKSREGSATDGVMVLSGGARMKSTVTTSTNYTLTTGEYYMRFTASGAKTCNFPATSAILGQVYEIFNDGDTGTLTLDGDGSDVFFPGGNGTFDMPTGSYVRVMNTEAGIWRVTTF